MLFCLNKTIYKVENLTNIIEILNLEDSELESILGLLYIQTNQALLENTETLLGLGLYTNELERNIGNIVLETQEFREFLTQVECSYPQVLLLIPNILIQEGIKISLKETHIEI